MCVKGLDLQEREWKIYANEPDLDAILSIWIILNYKRINNREAINRRSLFALVRLKGSSIPWALRCANSAVFLKICSRN